MGLRVAQSPSPAFRRQAEGFSVEYNCIKRRQCQNPGYRLCPVQGPRRVARERCAVKAFALRGLRDKGLPRLSEFARTPAGG